MVAKALVNVAEGGKGVRKQTCSFPLHVRGLGWGLGFVSTDPWSAWPTLPMSTSSASTLPNEAVDTATIECVAEVHDPHHDVCHPGKQHSHLWRNRRVFLISNLVVSCSRAPSPSVRNSSYCGGREKGSARATISILLCLSKALTWAIYPYIWAVEVPSARQTSTVSLV